MTTDLAVVTTERDNRVTVDDPAALVERLTPYCDLDDVMSAAEEFVRAYGAALDHYDNGRTSQGDACEEAVHAALDRLRAAL